MHSFYILGFFLCLNFEGNIYFEISNHYLCEYFEMIYSTLNISISKNTVLKNNTRKYKSGEV